MKYYISYKGQIYGSSMTWNEAEAMLQRLKGSIEALIIIEVDDKIEFLGKNNEGKRNKNVLQ